MLDKQDDEDIADAFSYAIYAATGKPQITPINTSAAPTSFDKFVNQTLQNISKAFDIPMHELIRRPPDILMELEGRADGMKIYSVRHARYDTRIVTSPEALTPFLDGYTFT